MSAEFGAPTIADISRGLARAQRFAGQGRYTWTVAEHSLFVERLAQEMGFPHRTRLLALMHDAHEAFTGDVPSPFKPPALRQLQGRLDRQIFRTLAPALEQCNEDEEQAVRRLDHRALLAEALVCGPQTLQTPADVREYFGLEPYEGDVNILRGEFFVGTFRFGRTIEVVFETKYHELILPEPANVALERTKAMAADVLARAQ